MSSNNQLLPRPILSIIEEAVPSALKLYSELKNKEKSLISIDNHIKSHTLPRSIRLQLDLVIPKCVLDDDQNSEGAAQSKESFKNSLKKFQQDAITQMRVIAEYAVSSQKKLLLTFKKQVELKIIDFSYRLLQKLDPTKAEIFKTAFNSYPNILEYNRSEDVKKAFEYITVWKSAYEVGLEDKLAKEVEKEIKSEKKINSKEAAEDIIRGDNDNDLVRDIIRREIEPLKKSGVN